MSHTFAIHRVLAYTWLTLLCSGPSPVILLGLTGYRVHVTEGYEDNFYEPIIVELLVSACLAIIWAPIAGCLVLRNHNASKCSPQFLSEMVGNFVLWVMWLVGAVDTTNRIIPGKNWCGPGKQCRILTAILAFSWIGWSFLTIIGAMSLMYCVYQSAQPAPIKEKPSNA
ncbi:uncharacterized protein EV420DRAFT_1707012 [Desarmillaria tabescens]|uniref:MARVEL domain-containing protein n=1 Tax=Armillaria tabescens TaxID=1929756 RepID=A0AA39JVZ6_ARMTA|nr:uncharacterized protein EV420DRAFT_1707012 [Desarmillaria tabescens]KAK0449834.1 hypothetical protein EV420DRAFT_1707012 [Desarmillaria tabescens]